jgi:hypothetical protein
MNSGLLHLRASSWTRDSDDLSQFNKEYVCMCMDEYV